MKARYVHIHVINLEKQLEDAIYETNQTF